MIDTYTKVAFAKLYDKKSALVAADMLSSVVIPWMEKQEVKPLRILTDRGAKYCGRVENHNYQLYLAIKISAIQKQKPVLLKRTGSVNGSIE